MFDPHLLTYSKWMLLTVINFTDGKDMDSVFNRIGYPPAWIEDAQRYGSADAYVAFQEHWAPGLPEIPNVRVDALLRSAARERPDDDALIELGRTIGYRELDTLVDRCASLLHDQGVGRGDIVAVMLPTSAAHWMCFFAATRIGAVHCGVNIMSSPAELAALLDDCRPRALIHLNRFAVLVDGLPKGLLPKVRFQCRLDALAAPDYSPYPALEPLWRAPLSVSETVDLFEAMPQQAPDEPYECDLNARSEPAQIVYTSGTTGVAKGALQSHFSLVHNALTHAHISRTTGRRVNFTVLPMFHTGGFLLWGLPTLASGGTVIPRPLFDPGDALAVIEQHRVSLLFGPPTLFLALLQHPRCAKADLSSLEVCATGAGPVPAELPKRWQEATGIPLAIGWGMTELNTMGTYNAMPGALAPGTIGFPVMGEVKISDDEGRVVRRGELGEIRFRGLQLSMGYLNKPAETRESFGTDGWFSTGDLGTIDPEGRLHFVERKKDLIIASGYNISPAEIEAVLVKHPRITDAGVVGALDPYRGETVVAFVVGNVDRTEVQKHCRASLSAYKVPSRIEVVAELPRNSTGKILRRELRKRITKEGE